MYTAVETEQKLYELCVSKKSEDSLQEETQYFQCLRSGNNTDKKAFDKKAKKKSFRKKINKLKRIYELAFADAVLNNKIELAFWIIKSAGVNALSKQIIMGVFNEATHRDQIETLFALAISPGFSIEGKTEIRDVFRKLLLFGFLAPYSKPKIYADFVNMIHETGYAKFYDAIPYFKGLDSTVEIMTDNRNVLLSELIARDLIEPRSSRFYTMAAARKNLLFKIAEHVKEVRLATSDIPTLVHFGEFETALDAYKTAAITKDKPVEEKMDEIRRIFHDILMLKNDNAVSFVHIIRGLMFAGMGSMHPKFSIMLSVALREDGGWCDHDTALMTIILEGTSKMLTYALSRPEGFRLELPMNDCIKLQPLIVASIKSDDYRKLYIIAKKLPETYKLKKDIFESAERSVLDNNVLLYVLGNPDNGDIRFIQFLVKHTDPEWFMSPERFGAAAPFLEFYDLRFLVEEHNFPVSPRVLEIYDDECLVMGDEKDFNREFIVDKLTKTGSEMVAG